MTTIPRTQWQSLCLDGTNFPLTMLRRSWGWTRLRIWTHAIDGLSENDFILAAKVDRAFAERSGG